jgi:hypothetical protein
MTDAAGHHEWLEVRDPGRRTVSPARDDTVRAEPQILLWQLREHGPFGSIGVAGNGQNANRSLLDAEDGVVDQDQVSGNIGAELDDRGRPRGNQRGLNVVLGIREAALAVDGIEYLADHVERGNQVRSDVADE